MSDLLGRLSAQAARLSDISVLRPVFSSRFEPVPAPSVSPVSDLWAAQPPAVPIHSTGAVGIDGAEGEAARDAVAGQPGSAATATGARYADPSDVPAARTAGASIPPDDLGAGGWAASPGHGRRRQDVPPAEGARSVGGHVPVAPGPEPAAASGDGGQLPAGSSHRRRPGNGGGPRPPHSAQVSAETPAPGTPADTGASALRPAEVDTVVAADTPARSAAAARPGSPRTGAAGTRTEASHGGRADAPEVAGPVVGDAVGRAEAVIGRSDREAGPTGTSGSLPVPGDVPPAPGPAPSPDASPAAPRVRRPEAPGGQPGDGGRPTPPDAETTRARIATGSSTGQRLRPSAARPALRGEVRPSPPILPTSPERTGTDARDGEGRSAATAGVPGLRTADAPSPVEPTPSSGPTSAAGSAGARAPTDPPPGERPPATVTDRLGVPATEDEDRPRAGGEWAARSRPGRRDPTEQPVGSSTARVHIARLEVLPPPTASSEPGPAPERAPRLSLDNYLEGLR